MKGSRGWLKLRRVPDVADAVALHAGGRWVIGDAARLDARLAGLAARPALRGKRLVVELSGLQALDTAGAWLLHRTMKELRDNGVTVLARGLRPPHAAMLAEVAAHDQACDVEPPPVNAAARVLAHVGRETVGIGVGVVRALGFLGEAAATFAGTLARPERLRFTALVHHVEQAGLNALPIVGLISFLIGVVMAYQGAAQLQRFGATIFAVDLIAVSVLRELGPLLTAIVVAGRSGSAFTAQIGSMKVNEEVDAMRTLGLSPMEVLVLPRLLALALSLPLLVFCADLMGLTGGALMSWAVLDIPPALFLERLREAVSPASFWVGMAKAPAFAVLIGLVGCFHGLQVLGSAESVGRNTTRAVVQSIFLVIVVDALFSILFSVIGV